MVLNLYFKEYVLDFDICILFLKIQNITIMELLIEERKYTVEEFLHQDDLDENFYYELIEGEIVKKSAPHYEHQRVSRKLTVTLDKLVTEKKLGGIFYAPIDVYLDFKTTHKRW